VAETTETDPRRTLALQPTERRQERAFQQEWRARTSFDIVPPSATGFAQPDFNRYYFD